MAIEQTLIILKPDAVQRKLVGRILQEFEDRGVTFSRLEMRTVSKELVSAHYPSSDEWFANLGGKTLSTLEKYGVDPIEKLGTNDAITIGKTIKGWLVDYMTSGPVVLGIIECNHAADVVRKLCGATLPIFSEPGTIRGKFAVDSPDAANDELRPVQNLIHASENAEEAQREIALWFGK